MSRRLRRSTLPPKSVAFSSPETARMFAQAQQLQQQGNLAAAEAQYREVLARSPRHADSLHYLGTVYYQQGRLDQAAELMAQSIVADGNRAAFYSNLGLVLQAKGMLEQAEAAYRRALELQPNYPEASNNLGTLLQPQGKLDEALVCYNRALAAKPDYGRAYCNAGTVLKEQGQLERAIEHFRTAARLEPRAWDTHYNLGNALQKRDKHEEAAERYKAALALRPNVPDVYLNWGTLLMAEGKVDDATLMYERSCVLFDEQAGPVPKPDQITAHMNLGMTLLLRGRFAEGFLHYEWRHRDKASPGYEEMAKPLWRGGPLHGARILLRREQGLGDTLQFLRYVPMVQAAGGQAVVQVQPCLRRLAERIPGVSVVLSGEPVTDFDTYCPWLSLPGPLGTTLETIPAAVPYLSVPEEERLTAASRAWPTQGLKVGIVWAGSPKHQADHLRSLTISQIEPLLTVPDVHFHSLQLGAVVDAPMVDLELAADNMADTAAKILHLDLVIAVDTAVAHLAGALGVPTWVLLPFNPDWRWLLERQDSPWYSTMRLFRQPRRGDWESVIQTVRTELATLAQRRTEA